MYTCLTNIVYLYLLAKYQDWKISYTKIDQDLGISRRTVSKRIKDLDKERLIKINDDNSINIYNNLNLNKVKINKYLDSGYSHHIIGYLLLKDT